MQTIQTERINYHNEKTCFNEMEPEIDADYLFSTNCYHYGELVTAIIEDEEEHERYT